MKNLGILLLALTTVMAGCDDSSGTEDAGSDAGEMMDTGTGGGDCLSRCEAKFTACGAPPFTLARCPAICDAAPTEEQLSCIEGLMCGGPDLMMGVFNGNFMSCDFMYELPDSGVMMDDGGVGDGGVDDGGVGDAGATDGGASDGGAADGGMADPMCEDRCTAKLVSCGAPNEAMARMRCAGQCGMDATEEQVMCLEMTPCPTVIMAAMSGGALPCFE